MDWQPIETAPKDGTWIVIWNERYSFCPIARWCVIDEDDFTCQGWGLKDDFASPVACCADGFIGYQEDVGAGFMPTHWMPLPQPPKAGE